MTQGELEKLPAEIVKQMNMLQIRIMDDIVRRIRINGFSTASADWQISRLQQLGMAEEDIRKWIRQALNTTEEEVDRIFSDEVYEQYMGHARAYNAHGQPFIPFKDNDELQQTLEAIKAQTMEEFRNMTGSLGFVTTDPARRLRSFSLSDYYVKTLDEAIMDIHSGAFDYNTVLRRTINEMTASGLRWIDYESGWHNRVPVAARRAVMTGFRQVQGKINEQVARDLHLDTYEVTVHIGARPTHQPWEGKVWTMEQLRTVCGLGTVTGLHGANCYHDYNAFDPEFDVRTYSDEDLERIHEEENTPKTYMGKEYTTYEALQRQRQLETRTRKYREDVHLLEQGMEGVSEEEAAKIKDTITLTKARYQGTLQEYQAFSKKMDLPMQKERIYQDGLQVDMRVKKQKSTQDEYEGIPKSWGDKRQISTESAIKNANPRYDRAPYGKKDLPYNTNCANCVVAAEMRFRGYNVIARAKNENRKLAADPFSAWIGAKPAILSNGLTELESFIEGLPEMSRTQVAVKYPNSIFEKRSNHTFIAVKKNKKILFMDPQDGSIVKSVEEDYFTGAAEISYCRIDNLEISDRGCTACERA